MQAESFKTLYLTYGCGDLMSTALCVRGTEKKRWMVVGFTVVHNYSGDTTANYDLALKTGY
jgi:hypothetical protein